MLNVLPWGNRVSMYTDDIPHHYYATEIPDPTGIPHTISTPDVVEAVVTHGGDVVTEFNYLFTILIVVTIIILLHILFGSN